MEETKLLTKQQAIITLGISNFTFDSLKRKYKLTAKKRDGATLLYDERDILKFNLRYNLKNLPLQVGANPLRCHSKEQKIKVSKKVWDRVKEDLDKQKLDVSTLSKLIGQDYQTLHKFSRTGYSQDALYTFYNIARWLGFRNHTHYVELYSTLLDEEGFAEASFDKPKDF